MSDQPMMTDTLNLEVAVSYWEVDRHEQMQLPAVFQLLQEAAIRHANQFGTGSHAMATRGESWVLNRLAAEIVRYPRFEDRLRIETWSSGIRGFRGYRDFRIYCGADPIAAASSLWLYVTLRNRALTRVPEEIARGFPTRPGTAFHPEIDRLRPAPPDPSAAERVRISVRYSDLDGNGHVNNTAYFDYLQTALARTGRPAHPTRLEIQFVREIAPATESVEVSLAAADAAGAAFSIGDGAELCAQGRVA